MNWEIKASGGLGNSERFSGVSGVPRAKVLEHLQYFA